MTERRGSITEGEIARALVDASGMIDFPPTPELATAVRARLNRAPHRPQPPRIVPVPWFRAAVAALAVVAILLAFVTITPPVRDAVADWLGLRGVAIVPVPEPTPDAAIPSGSPAVGAALLDGRRVSLAEASGLVSFPIMTPAASLVGPPDAVYVAGDPPGGRVTLTYAPRPDLPETRETGVGLLVTQFRGESIPFIQKGLSRGVTATPTNVSGARAFWIAGAPHLLITRDRTGAMHEQPSRLAANTLLWERDGITYRLESSLDLETAIRIAESMR